MKMKSVIKAVKIVPGSVLFYNGEVFVGSATLMSHKPTGLHGERYKFWKVLPKAGLDFNAMSITDAKLKLAERLGV